MEEIRIGIIGLGAVSHAHLSAYESLENVNIVSVCDVQAEKAREVAKRYKARAYSDYNELLSEGGIDLVLVLTPASTHREVVSAAAQAKIHIQCEKPLAVTLDDADAMVNECKKSGVKLFYGSCYRYLPAVRKAKEMIHAGVIGKVQLMTEQCVRGSGLDAYRELPPIHYPLGGPGGQSMGLMDHGIHLVDIFSWFCNSEIEQVHGKGQVSGEPAGSEYIAIQFANGAIGHLIYNRSTYSTSLPNEGIFCDGQGWKANSGPGEANYWESDPGFICIYGTTGSLRIYHYANALFLNNEEGIRRVNLVGRPPLGHFATQLEDCAQAIRENKEPSVTGEDGLRALKIVLEVYKKHNKNSIVESVPCL